MQMAATKVWTLEEVHSLPDDGNKYEIINGELYVTPSPSYSHELVAVRLTELLLPYVVEQRLGSVWHPRAVFRWMGSEVEPDLMVRPAHIIDRPSFDNAPLPLLVVEITSPSSRQSDRTAKRKLYREAGIPEYWIVDKDTASITVVKPNGPDVAETETVTWQPEGASLALIIQVASLFAP